MEHIGQSRTKTEKAPQPKGLSTSIWDKSAHLRWWCWKSRWFHYQWAQETEVI